MNDSGGEEGLRELGFLICAGAIVASAPLSLAQPAIPTARPAGPGDDDGEAPPGAYASPSAIPEGTVDERFGIPRIEGRANLDPILLPEGMGRTNAPQLTLPNLPSFAPQMLPSPNILRPERALVLNARLEEDGELIPSGLVWRLFSQTLNRDGQLQLVSVSKGGEAVFDVPAGSYLLHVGYGRAGLTKRIEFAGVRTSETITLEAGGLRLNASALAGSADPIRSDKLTFDIYSEETVEQERQLIAAQIHADTVVRLNAGMYEIVSNYGEVNAVARADIRVETGRITDARLQHRAAELTMKLVREEGGEAIADTAWSISSSQGDIIRESVGAFSSMVLAEGDYVIVAKNRERIYQREFKVEAGHNAEVELLVSEAPPAGGSPPSVEGSGD